MDYELRTKTKRTLKTTMEMEELAGLIDKICKMKLKEAKEFIWRMTYAPEYALGSHIIYLGIQNEEKMRVIRGELINQYRKVNPELDYQKYTIPREGESEATAALRKRAQGDGVIICEIQEKLKNCFLNQELKKWYAKTLRNERYKNMLAALRDIGFRGDGESAFVMKYVDIIADLLEESAKTQENI